MGKRSDLLSALQPPAAPEPPTPQEMARQLGSRGGQARARKLSRRARVEQAQQAGLAAQAKRREGKA